ncbi:Crp/Fnr family transcriptional regulator [Undibacterium sp. Di26W]|uniref:Crp/Fnr family transcriptional regulator n=1 Tax=Undibacterium sp. Di26W TaxID=3413035 RepID=UPI003BEFFA3F
MHTHAFVVGTVLYRHDEKMDTVYFPNDCLLSLMAEVKEQQVLEIALLGREGMLGYSGLASHQHSGLRVIVQQSGSADCISAAEFGQAREHSRAIQEMCFSYAEMLYAEASQIAVCSHFHLLEARLARSLLIMRERLQSDHFFITHEYLALALGVRRVGVTKAASVLQKRELISYSRGKVSVIDASGLLSVSCSCFQRIIGHGASKSFAHAKR